VSSARPRAFIGSERTNAGDLFSLALWLLWQCIRLPLFLLLAILEPIVSFVLGALALLGWLTAQTPFYTAFGVQIPSSHAALLLFMFVTPAFAFFATPLSSLWSRRHEFEADAFAARYASADDLATALVKLYRDNATTLTPDPLYSSFYYSHPPATERIARLRRNEVEINRLADPLDRPVRA